MKFILGKKLGMSQVFDKEGNQIPVTLVEAGPCQVLQLKTKEKDGYQAVQVGFKKIEATARPPRPSAKRASKKKIKKTMKGKEFRHLREFRLLESETSNLKPEDVIDVSAFQEGDIVKVSGLSKGKGFAGVVKRWGFHGRAATHGTKHEKRAPGSIGATTPERVLKGKKMAGRTGTERITVKNLKIVKIDKENNLLAVKGAVPGRKGALLEIRG